MTNRPVEDQRKWLVEWPSRLAPLADLVCFPGAGAGASTFRQWVARLPPFAVVAACQLPGREERIDEGAAASLSAAADTIAEACLSSARRSRPLVLFGHSMGAVLAFETACRLERLGHMPSALVLAASAPPHGAPAEEAAPSCNALRRLLLAYDSRNEALVSNVQLFDAVAPTLRADIAILRRHSIGLSARSAVPAWLLAGDADAVVPSEHVARWDGYFLTKPEVQILPGGHFFPFAAGQGDVLRLLTKLLYDAAGQVRG
jgi:pyochelin biosynthesis protein PchC